MRGHVRRVCQTLLICVLSLVSCGILNAEPADPSHNSRVFLRGGDISALAAIETRGGSFRDRGEVQDLIQIFSEHGCNCARLRLFVNPAHKDIVVNDLPYTLSLAKRVRSAGQLLLLDFHYSDTWADPGKQFKPSAWKALPFDQLEDQVREYTSDVMEEFRAEGVLPDIVQIGNEVIQGMLWPEGKIQYAADAEEKRMSWERFGRLLKAGIDGVRSELLPAIQAFQSDFPTAGMLEIRGPK